MKELPFFLSIILIIIVSFIIAIYPYYRWYLTKGLSRKDSIIKTIRDIFNI